MSTKKVRFDSLIPTEEEIEKELQKGTLRRIYKFFDLQNIAFLIVGLSVLIGILGFSI